MRFAYADPPYLGMGAAMYGPFHPEASNWDDMTSHVDLVTHLISDYPDGWVLSCLPRDLVWLLPLCGEGARVGAWVKTYHQIRPTSVQHAWEPVIWQGGRKITGRNPMVRDWMQAPATRMRKVPGTKPEQFNRWVADLLGYQEGDTLDDLFPGSGGMALELAQGVLYDYAVTPQVASPHGPPEGLL